MGVSKDKQAFETVLEGVSQRKENEVRATKPYFTIEDIYKIVEKQGIKITDLQNKLDLVLCSLRELENRNNDCSNILPLEKTHIEIFILILNINACLENDLSINHELQGYIHSEMNRVLSKYGYTIVDYSEATKEYYEIEYQPITYEYKLVRRALINNNKELIIKGKIYLKQ